MSKRKYKAIYRSGALDSPYGSILVEGVRYPNGTRVVEGFIVGVTKTTLNRVPEHWIKTK
jgi:hypothetical protein